MLVSGGLVSTF